MTDKTTIGGVMNDLDRETLARFWSKVDKRGPDECWEWTGRFTGQGVAEFSIGGHPFTAARVMLQIMGRKQPQFKIKQERMCGNPKCINPDHLIVPETWAGERQKHNQHRRPSLFELASKVGATLIPVGRGRYLVEMGR